MKKIEKFRICPARGIMAGFLLIAGIILICPGRAQAAQRKGSICVSLYCEEKKAAASDGVLTLYQVALLSLDDGERPYFFTPAFEGCGISLQDVSDPALSEKLAEWTDKQRISGKDEAVDSFGNVCFSDLIPGLYLIVQTGLSTGFYAMDPFLVSVPYQVRDNWIYDVDASPKAEVYPEPPSEEPTEGAREAVVSSLPQTGPLSLPLFLLTCGGMLAFAGGIRLYQK